MESFLAIIHGRFAIALLLFAALLGMWGGFQFLRHREVSGGFRSSFLLMAGLTAVQGLAGIGALVGGGRPRELLHVVYGAFAIVFLPGLYLYAGRGGRRDREAAFLVIGCWVVLIAYGRGFGTGR